MRHGITSFENCGQTLLQTAEASRAEWNDAKSDAFQEQVIAPLRQQSQQMIAEMEQLCDEMNRLYAEVNAL